MAKNFKELILVKRCCLRENGTVYAKWHERHIFGFDIHNGLGWSYCHREPFCRCRGPQCYPPLADKMSRRQSRDGLIFICATGAMAGAKILDRDYSSLSFKE